MPYALLLNHTVEEIVAACRSAEADAGRLAGFERSARYGWRCHLISCMRPTLHRPICRSKRFSAPRSMSSWPHGGAGEDGTLRACQSSAFPLTAAIARRVVCAWTSSAPPNNSPDRGGGHQSLPKQSLATSDLQGASPAVQAYRRTVRTSKRNSSLSPQSDGCSSGIVQAHLQHTTWRATLSCSACASHAFPPRRSRARPRRWRCRLHHCHACSSSLH